MSLKIAAILYYWPPAGGVGVRRWLYMLTHLQKENIDITVFHPENPDYDSYDKNLLQEIPPHVKTIPIPILEFRRCYRSLMGLSNKDGELSPESNDFKSRLMLAIRSNLFVPDARSTWIKPAYKTINTYFRESGEPDFLLSSGPPHSVHIIANRLKIRHPKIKWIADFRDPWTSIDYFGNLKMLPIVRNRHHYLERQVVQSCDLLITVSGTWKRDFEAIGARNAHVIFNGFDEDLDANIRTYISKATYTILHTGTVNQDRIPYEFLNTIKSVNNNKYSGANYRIQFTGNICPQLYEYVEKFQMREFIELNPHVPHKDLQIIYENADILLLLINKIANNAPGRIPAKLFEYLQKMKPILALGPFENDASQIVKDTNAGNFLKYADTKGIEYYLLNKLFENYSIVPSKIEIFSREKQAKKFYNIIIGEE